MILRNFIDGRFVDGGRPFDVNNPATGETHAIAHEADQAMIDAAVAAGRRSVEGEWGNMPLEKRRALLMKIADGIEARFDDFLAAEIADTGKPRTLAAHVDIPRGAANFRAFADYIASIPNEVFETDTPDGGRAINYSVRKPLGWLA
nr:aldehyde dehydrogenase family protein [Kineobactrum salinum]